MQNIEIHEYKHNHHSVEVFIEADTDKTVDILREAARQLEIEVLKLERANRINNTPW
jgi:hypothetical protein